VDLEAYDEDSLQRQVEDGYRDQGKTEDVRRHSQGEHHETVTDSG
jgi:hypothetical protein